MSDKKVYPVILHFIVTGMGIALGLAIFLSILLKASIEIFILEIAIGLLVMIGTAKYG